MSTKPEADPPITMFCCGAPCDHDFKGWREFEDGCGGETVCQKCGMGAMEWTLRNDPT